MSGFPSKSTLSGVEMVNGLKDAVKAPSKDEKQMRKAKKQLIDYFRSAFGSADESKDLMIDVMGELLRCMSEDEIPGEFASYVFRYAETNKEFAELLIAYSDLSLTR